MNTLKTFAILSAIALLSACNSNYQKPTTKLEGFYANGAPQFVIHYDKNKEYIGSYYYPDGTPKSISTGKIYDINNTGFRLSQETYTEFYPDGSLIPKRIREEKDFTYDTWGTFPFVDNGEKFFIDFSGERIGTEYILSVYIYPDNKNGEIVDRYILKCKYEKSQWVCELDSLFGLYKFEYNITGKDRLNVKIYIPRTGKKIFDFGHFEQLKALTNK